MLLTKFSHQLHSRLQSELPHFPRSLHTAGRLKLSQLGMQMSSRRRLRRSLLLRVLRPLRLLLLSAEVLLFTMFSSKHKSFSPNLRIRHYGVSTLLSSTALSLLFTNMFGR